MKGLLWVLALFCLLAGGKATSCSCQEMTLEEQFTGAETVFLGRITDAVLLEGDDSFVNTGSRMVEAHYEVMESFKGKAVNGGRLFDREDNDANCNVGLVVSGYYIFFVDKNLLVSACNGTRRYTGPVQLDGLRQLSGSAD